MIEEAIVWLVLIIGWASLLCVGGVIADAIERRLQDTDIDRNRLDHPSRIFKS